MNMNSLTSQLSSMHEDDKMDALIGLLDELKVSALVKLISDLEEKWGVKAQVAIGGSSGAGAGAAAAEPQKSEFDLVLTDFGANKLSIIKLVRELTSLGLSEAKSLVEKATGGATATLKEKMSKDEAEKAKAKLEEQGAKVKLV